MGLPVKFVCAVNQNDVVARTLSKGDYSVTPVTATLAPAMDIQVSNCGVYRYRQMFVIV